LYISAPLSDYSSNTDLFVG